MPEAAATRITTQAPSSDRSKTPPKTLFAAGLLVSARKPAHALKLSPTKTLNPNCPNSVHQAAKVGLGILELPHDLLA